MVLCTGQALIDCIITGSAREPVAESISLCPGGEAFNQAVTLARLGCDVQLLSGIGQDPAGMLLIDQAEKEGIHLLPSGYDGPTPVSLLTVNETGGRTSRVSKAHRLTGFVPALPEGITPAAVTMGSLFRPPFLDPAICRAFAAGVKKTGALLCADTKLPKGAPVSLQDYRDTLPLLRIITPNQEEAAYYTGTTRPEEGAKVFHGYGVSIVVIKLAERGCYVSSQKEGAFSLPAFSVPVADGVGAGDAFTAGLILRLLEGADLWEAARFASACAALSVTCRGAIGGIRSREQVEHFHRQQPLS